MQIGSRHIDKENQKNLLDVISSTNLNAAYRKLKDSNVRERILLIRRVKCDNEEAASVAEKEFDRSRWWAYKWLKRFQEEGLDGLRDKHRSGRPPDISEETSVKIRREFSDMSTYLSRDVS